MKHDPDDAPVGALGGLPRELAPPAALEERTVASLRAAGLLLPLARRTSPMRTWLLAAGVAIAAFAGGIATARSSAPAAAEPTFALLLYGGGTADSAAHEVRAAEYGAWAGAAHPTGRVVGGEALGGEGTVVAPGMAPGGVEVSEAGDGALVGYFLVHAVNREAALQLARDCPHLKYGGRVVVRPILPT